MKFHCCYHLIYINCSYILYVVGTARYCCCFTPLGAAWYLHYVFLGIEPSAGKDVWDTLACSRRCESAHCTPAAVARGTRDAGCRVRASIE